MPILRYTKDHEWLREDAEGKYTIGISDYAQEQLGDIVYVEFPEVGSSFAAGDQIVVIESVKAVGEIAAPLAGTIDAVNDKLADAPETINESPMGDGWLITVTANAEVPDDELMDAAAYRSYTEGL